MICTQLCNGVFLSFLQCPSLVIFIHLQLIVPPLTHTHTQKLLWKNIIPVMPKQSQVQEAFLKFNFKKDHHLCFTQKELNILLASHVTAYFHICVWGGVHVHPCLYFDTGGVWEAFVTG